MDQFTYISNAEPGFIDGLYEQYKFDPESVDSSWKKFFEGFEFASKFSNNGLTPAVAESPVDESAKEVSVSSLIHAYRSRAHLLSTTNPIRTRKDRKPQLELEHFGLTEADLAQRFASGSQLGMPNATLKEIIETLEKIYIGNIGFEYFYIRQLEVREWLRNKIEKEAPDFRPEHCEKKRILFKLNEAVVFESFLHTKYIGQKRFSLEGGESTIPAMDEIVNRAGELGVEEVVIGMAHRGRLNILANILGKTYEQIFNEFEGNVTGDSTLGGGDVKYHLGFSGRVPTRSGKKVYLKLTPNPSHLEAVNPVVEGIVRGQTDSLYNKDTDKALPILIHGDAALAGQGIVYELAQMSQLPGYSTGGTIHFVINNQIGFTTDFDDARSSIYCTDVAKILDAPVLHVNGDDVEKVVFAVRLAVEYRQKFKKDIFIDMVCYRKHGHNEGDEPKFTQPSLYKLIGKHPNPREVYNQKLIKTGDVDADLAKKMDKEFKGMLQDRLNMVRQNPLPYEPQPLEKQWQQLRRATPEDFEQSPDTAITKEVYDAIAQKLYTLPDHIKPLRKVKKLIDDRKTQFTESKMLNWANAELLAYGSILLEKKIVRLTGQDVVRGTFSHRHSVIRDAESNQAYNSLNHLGDEYPNFEIYNSLLSEAAVLGYEIGYAMANPNALTIWEAQFGDFSNGAQVMIDQFLTSMETKWQKMNGLVLLLPHGYEGQGPEHSSARGERFLQLCANNNLIVANITTPANLFHFFRRQLAWAFRKPAVLLTPKSLLRHAEVVSAEAAFLNGRFEELIVDEKLDGRKKIKRIVFCTGKIYYDLKAYQTENQKDDVLLVRLEQMYPFPGVKVQALKDEHPEAELYWVQEEPENMGAWWFIQNQCPGPIKHIARKASSSPATGFAKVHINEQNQILEKAFTL